MKNQTIWVKNEESLLKLLRVIWDQWGTDISFNVEQDGCGFLINFNF